MTNLVSISDLRQGDRSPGFEVLEAPQPSIDPVWALPSVVVRVRGADGRERTRRFPPYAQIEVIARVAVTTTP